MESGHFTHHSQLQNFEFSVMICILAIFNLYKTIHKSYQIYIKLFLYIGDTYDRYTNHLNNSAYIAI